jgi:hypothetical protein
MEGRSGTMAHLNKWLVRLGLVGAIAAILAGWLLWLVLTQPVAVALALEKVR